LRLPFSFMGPNVSDGGRNQQREARRRDSFSSTRSVRRGARNQFCASGVRRVPAVNS
jgi:hypothetical protein